MEKKKQRSIVTIVIYFQVMEEEIIRHSINAHSSKPAQPAKKLQTSIDLFLLMAHIYSS